MSSQAIAATGSAPKTIAPGGLTASEAAERLQQVGANAVAEKHPSELLALLSKFWGVIPWMLEIAVILDIVLGRWIEAAVIASLLLFNALMGFAQERRATGALALLRQRLTVNARVRRDGHWRTIPASEVVPGDLVRLRIGDIVPADIRLSDGEVLLDQSVLTGESLPTEHQPGSTAYSGSLVRRGEASGEVVATGARTYFGKTSDLVQTAEAPPRLERFIVEIAKYIAALDVLLALAVLAAAAIWGTPLFDVLPFVLMLLVASIPHILPTMFTMSASLGARALADKGILVTRLSAIEDAASMDVLCLDKTGTLTENHLTIQDLVPSAAATSDELLRLAALASEEATQDPIDLTILEAARERGLLSNLPSRLDFVPFDPTTKRSEISIRAGDQVTRIVKGEPATVAELTRTPWPDFSAEVSRLSADGSRVLTVASGTGSDLHLAGLVALGDRPRSDSASLIAELRSRGVRVLLVTGDGEATARAVAAKVGITGDVAPAGTIHENLDPEEAMRFGIFARVFPQDKFALVQALQRAGYVVGMTGDGVNDAPALKQADVGIAVASATDVAKAAASLVLTKPGLGEVIAAIDGSRRIYQRMKTFVLTMNARKISIPLFLSLGVLVFGAFVQNPLLMVLFMLIADIATMSVSMDEVVPSSMPDHWDVRPLMISASGIAALLFAMSGAVFWGATNALGLSIAETQTLVFVWLVFAGSQAVLYLTRVRGFFWTKPYPGRAINVATLLAAGVVTLLATQGWLMTPISLSLVGGTLLLAALFLVFADLLKVASTWLTTMILQGRQRAQASANVPTA
jgi:H+-transporting ATPase